MTALPVDFLDEDPLRRYRREHDERQAELERERRREERERQRNASQVAMAPDDYWAEVDRRIEEKINAAMETCAEEVVKLLDKEHDSLQAALDRRDEAIKALRDEVEVKIGLERKLARLKVQIAEARQMQPNFGQALDKRDREIENLWREIKLLRDEVGLERGLSKLKSEVAAAREMQPNFESELDGLRKEITKHEKTISRLRGQTSQLEFAQKQLETEQTKNRQQVTLTAAQLTAIGAKTREVLECLRENGVDFIEEWSPSGPAS